jgi:Family of unknown function (DUF5522)
MFFIVNNVIEVENRVLRHQNGGKIAPSRFILRERNQVFAGWQTFEHFCSAFQAQQPMKIQPQPLILGEDYYLEAGKYVFTAAYHLKRGYCCGSGCRHCPYPKETEKQENDWKEDATVAEKMPIEVVATNK